MRNTQFLKALTIGGFVALTCACGSAASHDDGGSLAGTGGTAGTAGGGLGGQSATGGILGSGGGSGLGGSALDAASTGGGGSGGQSATGGILGSGGSSGRGGSGSDAAGTTGSGSGGKPATGGIPGDGGNSGRGDGGMDAAVVCTDDGGTGLPAVARRCSSDADCTIAIAARCCGADQALGEAKSATDAYAACLALPPGACAGLGCAKFLGYVTDTGRTTPVVAATEKPIDWVVVRCSNGLCTSYVPQQSCDGACQPDVDSSACSDSCAGGTPCPDRCSAACAQGKICCPWAGGPCIPNDAGGCSGAQGYSCATATAAGTCPNQCYP